MISMKENMKDTMKKVSEKAKKEVKERKIIEEFREFIARGNVLDLAVGVIIGGAFQSLVTSLTDNIISPILGCFTEVDFNSYALNIGNLHLKYGAFLTDIINFIIMAFVVFLIVKFMNKILVRKEKNNEKTKQEPSEEVKLLTEIRDLLNENEKR